MRTASLAVETMLTNLGDQRLKNLPQMEKVRFTILQEALKLYRRLLQEQSSDPMAKIGTAIAYKCVGKIEGHSSPYPESIDAYQNSIRLFEKLVAVDPDDPDHRYNLAVAFATWQRVSQDRAGKTKPI